MKNKTKNLIYMLLLLVMMPAARVSASPQVEPAIVKPELRIVESVKEASVVIEIDKNISIPKNIIDENKLISTPTPSKPVPVHKSYSYTNYSVDEIKSKICQVFGPECSNALIIAFRESGYRQFAISKTNDYGIFQMNCRWQGRRVGGVCTRYFDVDTNIRIAKQIFDEQGWNPWTTKKYLPKQDINVSRCENRTLG